MPVIIALEKLHKIPVKPWTGPFLTQGNLPLLKSRLLVQVTPPQPLYRCLMESRPSDAQLFRNGIREGLPTNHPESLDPCGTCCVGYNRAHVWRLGPEQN